eukprot:5505027-Heterocapsa_arctica.AAC.1
MSSLVDEAESCDLPMLILRDLFVLKGGVGDLVELDRVRFIAVVPVEDISQSVLLVLLVGRDVDKEVL